MRAWSFVFVFVFVARLLGCDASGPLAWTPVYDPDSRAPVASIEFCSLLSRNTCAVLRPCCESLPFAWDEAKCRSNARALCEARREKAMALGLSYDDLQAGRCVRGAAVLLPECRSATDDPIAADVREACQQVFHGQAEVSGACEGKRILECAPPDLGVRVVCSGGRCAVRALLPGGAECLGAAGQCAPGLACFGDPPLCRAVYHPLGAPCTPTTNPESDRCDASRDRFCDARTSPSVCARLPDLGERCDADYGCRRPWRCDAESDGLLRCTDAHPLGATCNDDKECASKLCSGQPESSVLRVCVPSGLGPPIAAVGLAKLDPVDYVSRIAAMCSGLIPEGAGSLAPFTLPAPK